MDQIYILLSLSPPSTFSREELGFNLKNRKRKLIDCWNCIHRYKCTETYFHEPGVYLYTELPEKSLHEYTSVKVK